MSWFVVNAREAQWEDDGELGVFTPFGPDEALDQYGVRVGGCSTVRRIGRARDERLA